MNMETRKRPILLWQMILLVVLPLAVLISAFFPRISITAEKIADIYKNFYEAAADMVSDATGGFLGGSSGLEGLMGSSDDAAEEMKKSLEKQMKADFSFTGWELMFLTDDMVIEKVIHTIGEDEKLDQEEMDKAIREFKEDESSEKMLEASMDFLGYMRVGYMLLYIGCLLLIILSVLWFAFRWNGTALVITNLAVSIGGAVVTGLGTLNIGHYALNSMKDAADLGGILGSQADMFGGMLDMSQLMGMFEKPMRLFGIAITMTFGGIGCAIICAVMLLFAIYMMVDHFVLAKKRVAVGDPIPMGAGYADSMAASMGTGYAAPMSDQIPVQGMAAAAYEPYDASAQTLAAGKIRVTRGEFSGAEIEVRDGEEVILGRDPSACHLVFKHGKISRKHCGVRYNPHTNTYFVKNYSMNGTSFASGESVSSDVFVEVAPGNIIQLADGREEIVLG